MAAREFERAREVLGMFLVEGGEGGGEAGGDGLGGRSFGGRRRGARALARGVKVGGEFAFSGHFLLCWRFSEVSW